MPKVSVIVPVYNAEQYIVRCIESVKAQTLTDWELILVDDASSDNSVSLIRVAANQDTRICCVENKVNRGTMIVRQEGIKIVHGEYITFLDSDDVLPSTSLEKMYYSAVNTTADIVSGFLLSIPFVGSPVVRRSLLKYGNDRGSINKSLLRFELPPNLCGKLFKRGLLTNNQYEAINGMRRGEDAYLFYQIVDSCQKCIQIDEVVYHYFDISSSSSHQLLTDHDLDCFMYSNKKRIDTIMAHYPELSFDLFRHVSLNINAFYAQGYAKGSSLNMIVSKYDLDRYVRLREMKKYFTIVELLEIIAKRYAFPILGRKFDGWRI